MEVFFGVFFAFSICVILPIAIVWLVLRARQNKIDREAEIMLRALDAGLPIDKDRLTLGGRQKTLKKRLLNRLTAASIFTLLGIVYLVMAFVEFKNWTPTPNAISESYDFEDFWAAGTLLAIGIALFFVYFVGKKQLAKDIEPEEDGVDN